MKNIIDVYEGLLSDIDNTLQSSDKFISAAETEFQQLKNVATKSTCYDKFARPDKFTDYRIGLKAVNLLRYIGDTKNDRITVSIVKHKNVNVVNHKVQVQDECTIVILLHSITSSSKDLHSIEIPVVQEHMKFTLPKLLKQYIVPIFDNLETFKDFINSN